MLTRATTPSVGAVWCIGGTLLGALRLRKVGFSLCTNGALHARRLPSV